MGKIKILFFALIFAITARADVLIYDFSGAITDIATASESVSSSIELGSPFHITYLVDTDTVIDIDAPHSENGNYWAFTAANHVELLIGDFTFFTKSDNDHPLTIQTYPSLNGVAFFAFEFYSPQFVDVGSGTSVKVSLQDESFTKDLPMILPDFMQLESASWNMGLYNGSDQFSVSGVLDSANIYPVPEPKQLMLVLIALICLYLAHRGRWICVYQGGRR